jgi:DNA-binding transcriptional ArsR family regulator
MLDNPLKSGWRVGPSIATELDVALSAVRDYSAGVRMPAEFADLLKQIPEAWRDDMPEVLVETRGFASLLAMPAYLAGVSENGDYSRATLAIRDLSLSDAHARLAETLRPYGVIPDPSLPLDRQFVDLGTRGWLAIYNLVGFKLTSESTLILQARHEFERSLMLFSGSPGSAQFWHWLDRFYFQAYYDWRRTRITTMEEQKKRALETLGALSVEGEIPDLTWLPAQNPLKRFSTITDATLAHHFSVYFWIEPFGMADTWGLYPGMVFVSFAEPGPIYQNFRESADDVANRVKALADPTRLIILRLIRHFGMVNTEIAEYLDLARPTVSIHAKILRDAGLIRSMQAGREVRHEIVPSEVRRLFMDLEYLLDLPEEPEE